MSRGQQSGGWLALPCMWLCRGFLSTHMLRACVRVHCSARQVLQQANNFSAINCSNTLWACASLRHYSPPLFTALLERLGCHLEEVEPQNVANALYALARVNHPLGDHAGVASWSRAEVAARLLLRSCTLLLAGGFFCMLFDPSSLYRMHPDVSCRCVPCGSRAAGALVAAAKRLMPHMNQQELCNTVWGLGVLGQLDKDTWEEFCGCIVNTQGVSCVSKAVLRSSDMLRPQWAAGRVCFDRTTRASAGALTHLCLLPPCCPAGLTPEGVHQAFHAQLMLHSHIAHEAGVALSSLTSEQLPTLPAPLAEHARHMWLASAVDVHVSKLQTDVSGALAVAGIPNTIEWLTDDGLFSIDIAFEVSFVGGFVFALCW